MTAETLRWALILAGMFVLGFDVAVLRHARQIVRAVLAWRVFIIGKAFLMVYVLLALHDNIRGPVGWRLPLAGVAMALTLVGAAMLDHSYRKARQL